MQADWLYLLTHAHEVIAKSGALPEGTRPYNVAAHLNKLQTLIMKEIEKDKPNPKPTPKSDDNIPF